MSIDDRIFAALYDLLGSRWEKKHGAGLRTAGRSRRSRRRGFEVRDLEQGELTELPRLVRPYVLGAAVPR